MSQGSNRVRDIQAHLRRAGTLLAEQQYDAARTEIDKALAIDAGSLAALALRERVDRARVRQGLPAPPVPPARPAQIRVRNRPAADAGSAVAPALPRRFVPAGVDAQSWLGFEQRIQQRRFQALLETIDAAVAAGDGIAARVALEEARELRPDAPQLDAVADRVALLRMALPAAGSSSYFGSRAVGAVAMLLTGVTLLIGLDRAADPEPISEPLAATAPESAAPARSTDTVLEPQTPAVVIPAATTFTPDPAEPAGASGSRPASALDGPTNSADSSRIARPSPPTAETSAAVGRAPAPPRPAVPPPAAEQMRRASAPDATDTSRTPVPDAVARDTSGTAGARTQPPSAAPPPGPNVASSATAPAQPAGTVASSSQPAATVASSSPAPRPSPAVSSPSRATNDAGAAQESLESNASAASAPVTAPIVPAVETSATAAMIADETGGIRQALNMYARAFTQLDAGAVRAVWPSVDERGLARAFNQLESQAVSFDNCEIQVRGSRADVSCRGRASFVGKVGSREERTEPRQWRFDLRRDGDAWKIQTAEARRTAYQD